ncbi:MAG: universal stress protein [Halobacteria archaeon]|nr:universal stress protein [Halobacteria archaeon]
MKILAPVRYPITENSKQTLRRALEIREENQKRDESTELLILHVNLFQDSKDVTREKLRKEVFDKMGEIDATYLVREGFLIEEAILEEAARNKVDLIVLGKTRAGRLRRSMRRLIGNDPNIENYLRERLDTDLEVVG